MRRRLFTLATALSLLLLALSILVLIASYLTTSPVPRLIGTDFFHLYRGMASFGTRTSIVFQERLVYHYEPSVRFDLWHLTYATAVLPLIAAGRLAGAYRRQLGSSWRRQRADAGRCSQCGYNLAGNTSGLCPECGTKIGNQWVEISNGPATQ